MDQIPQISISPMFNAYPDSIGRRLCDAVTFLERPEVSGAFGSFYILPSVFNTDLDRGFSVISYDLNRCLANGADLEKLKAMGIELNFDLILNHASVLSPQFQDLVQRGQDSPYKDFFINWNEFWAGQGTMTADGYIQPDPALIEHMFFRKPGLPILMVRMPDGQEIPYWNTFYQEVRYPRLDAGTLVRDLGLQYTEAQQIAAALNTALVEGQRPTQIDWSSWPEAREPVVNWLENHREYLGQMDLNIRSPLVWKFYADTLRRLAGYGARLIRLDAFAYASKKPGAPNFLNEPDTWDILARVQALADPLGLALLPEIHASYAEKIHEKLCEAGCVTYDFFLPGLILDALERRDVTDLVRWCREILIKKLRVVNMLGCHDGIPLLDLKGLLPEDRIQKMIDVLKARGGLVKDLHGAKNMYYQVNCTYFSALGADENKMLLARALQLFMPGKPQVWYLDLFTGENDTEAVRRAGSSGHKEINRTNLTLEQTFAALQRPVVRRQLELLKFRNICPAFAWDSHIQVEQSSESACAITWEKNGYSARLDANLADGRCRIVAAEPEQSPHCVFSLP